ncbi:hypothetical protein P606_13390 [Comamonas thiooxydans]|nr:hypothetical protein P606_13390 [Comamonas thiooxydans]
MELHPSQQICLDLKQLLSSGQWNTVVPWRIRRMYKWLSTLAFQGIRPRSDGFRRLMAKQFAKKTHAKILQISLCKTVV